MIIYLCIYCKIWAGHGLDGLWSIYLLILWGIQLCYVCLLYRWYYGNINRQKAEKLLLASQNKTGSFLVRISESHSDEYTISGLFPYFRSLSHTHCLDWMPGDLPPVRIPLFFSHTSSPFSSSFFSHLLFSVWSAWRQPPLHQSYYILHKISVLCLSSILSLALSLSLFLSTPQLVTPYWSSMYNWLSIFLSPQESSGCFLPS